MNANRELIKRLRKIATFLEAHPELPEINTTIDCYCFMGEKQDLSDIMGIGLGHLDKYQSGGYVGLVKRFNDDAIKFLKPRSAVCRLVGTNKRTIPAQPERVVEEPIWECPDSFLKEKEHDHQEI